MMICSFCRTPTDEAVCPSCGCHLKCQACGWVFTELEVIYGGFCKTCATEPGQEEPMPEDE